MVLAPSRILQIVKKTTGGRAWLAPWGLTGLTKTQKANRKKSRREEHETLDALKAAAKREPPSQLGLPTAAGGERH